MFGGDDDDNGNYDYGKNYNMVWVKMMSKTWL